MAHPAHRVWSLLARAARTFIQIDGAQRAGAIAHYAFFSLFPLIILSVAVATAFVDRHRAATQIIAFVQFFVPVGDEKQRCIFDTIAGVVKARGPAGTVSFVLLTWAAMRFLATLIRATNRAWSIEARDWWRLPLKSFVFLAVIMTAVPTGIAARMLVKVARAWLLPEGHFSSLAYALGSLIVPLWAVFLGLSLFYKLAPRSC
jgi:uncharacterized BrkB/YihY/UPF0761 family membrane protein